MLLAMLLASACMPAVHAQQAEKVRVIGYLSLASGPGSSLPIIGQGLRDLGWIEGKNLRIEFRWRDNKPERLAPLAEELVRLNVELIIASSTPAVQAAKSATTTIPIVMGAAADPEGSGFVASLARPGGNITGVSQMMPALSGKRLELLREIAPRLGARLAFAAVRHTLGCRASGGGRVDVVWGFHHR
jgi:putative ABC transport system substrate-binding protein